MGETEGYETENIKIWNINKDKLVSNLGKQNWLSETNNKGGVKRGGVCQRVCTYSP